MSRARRDTDGMATLLAGPGPLLAAMSLLLLLLVACLVHSSPRSVGAVDLPAQRSTAVHGPARQAYITGPAPTGQTAGMLVHFLNLAPAITPKALPPHGPRGKCSGCHRIVTSPTSKVAANLRVETTASAARPAGGTRQPPLADRQRAAAPAAVAPAGRPTPSAPVVPGAPPLRMLPFQEAHWQGLELIALTPSIARVLKISRDARGVLVDEVTMPADVEGFAAGDVIVSVGGVPTPNLERFVDAADRARDRREVRIALLRKNQARVATLRALASRLGTAVGETAPMIRSGARSPHGNLGPCTNCHHIGNGGNLAVDLGDALAKKAPPIRTGQVRPHRDRGKCSACHTIR